MCAQKYSVISLFGIKFTGGVEVDQAYVFGEYQNDIGWIDITVDDRRITSMKGRENITQLAYDIDGSILWKVKRII